MQEVGKNIEKVKELTNRMFHERVRVCTGIELSPGLARLLSDELGNLTLLRIPCGS